MLKVLPLNLAAHFVRIERISVLLLEDANEAISNNFLNIILLQCIDIQITHAPNYSREELRSKKVTD